MGVALEVLGVRSIEPDPATFSVGVLVGTEVGEGPSLFLVLLDEVEELFAAVSTLWFSSPSVNVTKRIDSSCSPAARRFSTADGRIGDRVTHGVVEGSTPSGGERLPGERRDFRYGEGIGEDFVRIVRVELDERHQSVRRHRTAVRRGIR